MTGGVAGLQRLHVVITPWAQPDAVTLENDRLAPELGRTREVVLSPDARGPTVDRILSVGKQLRRQAVEGEPAGPRHPPRGEVALVGLPEHPDPALVEPPLGDQPQSAGHEVPPPALRVQPEAD